MKLQKFKFLKFTLITVVLFLILLLKFLSWQILLACLVLISLISYQFYFILSRTHIVNEQNDSIKSSSIDHNKTSNDDLLINSAENPIPELQSTKTSLNTEEAIAEIVKQLCNDRKELNYTGMDQCYLQLEKLCMHYKDLIPIYKKHLAIKKILNDFPGQIEINSALGKIYYDLGETVTSKKYYEKTLRFKA